uniref:Ionotropic receptor 41a.3 n=1 Tax=Adelphocoris lineolatus TaxID=236346 RepID=A0A2I4PGY8_ADELI|nr:ionotropic receptor 41a.3 [Adelphocoris lineolatus]
MNNPLNLCTDGLIISMWLFVIGSSTTSQANVLFDNKHTILLGSLEKSVITQYFHKDKCIVLIVEDDTWTTNKELEHYYSLLSLILVSSIDICRDPYLVESIVSAIDSGCYSYILRVAEPKCVLKSWGESQLSYNVHTFQRVSPKMFATISNHQKDGSKIVDEFYSLPEAELSSNIVVAVFGNESLEWPVTIYTNNFYEPMSSADREPKVFLDRWNELNGFELQADLYADKILDLQGKELKVAVVDLLPYAELRRFIGQEAQILKHFCAHRNCTIKGITDEWFWGEIFENGSGNGLLGMVFDGRADFGIAGVYGWASVFRHTEFSASYLHSGVTLLVPKPVKVGGWLIPIFPFSSEMWLAYILSVIVAGISMHIITMATIKYTRFAEVVLKRGMFLTAVDTAFRALGLSVLQQPSTPLVPHTPIRHLFTAFEILYLVFCTVYAAELASYLTAPQYSKPIDSLEDLADSGMIWLGEHYGWVYSLLDVDTPSILKIVDHFKVVTFEEMDKLAGTGMYGLIVEQLAGGHFSERQYLSEKIIAQSHIMAEYLYDSPVITIMRKCSPYREHYNELIGRLLENGLLLFWEAEAARVYMSSWLQTALKSAIKVNMEDEARALTLSDCLGMFLLLAFGLFTSSVVFIVELWIIRQKNNTKD